MVSRSRLMVPLVLVLCVLMFAPPAALGHQERETFFPDGTGTVPTYRTTGPTIVVCKAETADRLPKLPPDLRAHNQQLLAECRFNHIQQAVDAVTERGTRILVLPGLYQEEPSLAVPDACEQFRPPPDIPTSGVIMTYEEQRECPSAQNLVWVFGDTTGDRACDAPVCDLQIEGTGARPEDVIVDAQFAKLNGIRADRADGISIRNLTVERTEFNGVYVLETDGFVVDRVVGRWNDEYGFLTFAVDHGLYTDCEAYGNGDAGLYPGSASDINADQETHDVPRYAVEIRNCVGHHNALAYSGTAGNSVWAHDNDFLLNATGATMDSVFPDHPGFPQDHAFFQANRIRHNNLDYYEFVREGRCRNDVPFSQRGYEQGVVCPTVPVGVGHGVVIAGGNWNRFEHNEFYDNWRQATLQTWAPALLRDEMDPALQFDTSHHNRYVGNRLGFHPRGWVQPNGQRDFWWDDQGTGNCWQGNVSATPPVRSNATAGLPTCDAGGSPGLPANPAKTGQLAPCVTYDRNDASTPEGCDWFEPIGPPDNRGPASAEVRTVAGANRILTAIEASRASFPDGTSAVIVARADDYADALVAAPLAAYLEAPILLVSRTSVPAEVAAEIRRLGATRAFVMGGAAALTAGVDAGLLTAGVTDVQRIAGGDRFDTAARVARLLGHTQVYIAKGADADPARGWPDALAVSGLAAAQLRPILLVTGDQLPPSTLAALVAIRADHASIIGGTAAVSAEVEAAVAQRVGRVERLAGANRFETSVEVARRADWNVMDPHSVWFATGANWPDALVAGPVVARDGGILLLVDGEQAARTGPSGAFFDRPLPVDRVTLLGGSAVLNPAAVPQGL